MDSAKAAVRLTLDQTKTFLAQESPPKLSEADTKANFIEPIISALGWTGIAVVTREYYVKNSQEFIDYVMRGPTGLLLAIESKALQADLTDKAAAQLIQYCSVEGIEWAALTNGRELQFFNTFLKPDLSAKRILSLDLLAFNLDAEFDALFQQLWQLSRESMTTPKGVRDWLNQRRMDATLRGILLNPASSTTKQLRKALVDADVRATPQDVTQWFRSHLGTPITALPHPTQPQPVPHPGLQGGQLAETSEASVTPPDSAQGAEFDPRTSQVFGAASSSQVALLATLAGRVVQRMPGAHWRAQKYYVAAELNGETFVAVKRRKDALVLGLALPETASFPGMTSNATQFNWARITKVVHVGGPSDMTDALLALIEQAASHVQVGVASKAHHGTSVRELLGAGLLKAGERIFLTAGKAQIEAELSATGEIIWDGQTYRYLSHKAFAAAVG